MEPCSILQKQNIWVNLIILFGNHSRVTEIVQYSELFWNISELIYARKKQSSRRCLTIDFINFIKNFINIICAAKFSNVIFQQNVKYFCCHRITLVIRIKNSNELTKTSRTCQIHLLATAILRKTRNVNVEM